MSHPLNLPEPVYDALELAATASGTTPVGWIVAHLPSPPPASDDAMPDQARTMAELFAGHIGTISSGERIDRSKSHSERFSAGLQRKRREGRL